MSTGSGGPVVVVHDAQRTRLDEDRVARTGAIVIQRTTPVRRGHYSMLEPYFAGVNHLLERGIPFDWVVYLSGQDYPVRPVGAVERDLASCGADGLIAHWDLASPACPWDTRRGRRRYLYQYALLPDLLRPVLRLCKPFEAVTPLHLFLTYGALIGWPARRHPFDDGFRCYGGWMWHALRRPCVEHLLDSLAHRPDLVAYYRRTVVPDESLIQTVLANAGRFRLIPDSRRLADTRDRPGGHARVLTLDDLAEATSGRYDFARKMDPVASAALLDALDARSGASFAA